VVKGVERYNYTLLLLTSYIKRFKADKIRSLRFKSGTTLIWGINLSGGSFNDVGCVRPFQTEYLVNLFSVL